MSAAILTYRESPRSFAKKALALRPPCLCFVFLFFRKPVRASSREEYLTKAGVRLQALTVSVIDVPSTSASQ